MQVNQRRSSEDTYDRTASEKCLDNGRDITDLIEKRTEHHQKEESPYHAFRQYSESACSNNNDCDYGEHDQVYPHNLDVFHACSPFIF